MNIKIMRLCHAAIKNKKGFTLVELLVVVAILALVLSMFYQFFGFSGNMMKKTDSLGDQQNAARQIVQGLRKDIGTARTVAIVPAGDPASYPVPADKAIVYIADGELWRKEAAGTPVSIYTSYPVDDLKITFTATSASVLRITVYLDVADDITLAETDVNTLNTIVDTDTDSGFASTGSAVVYTPTESQLT